MAELETRKCARPQCKNEITVAVIVDGERFKKGARVREYCSGSCRTLAHRARTVAAKTASVEADAPPATLVAGPPPKAKGKGATRWTCPKCDTSNAARARVCVYCGEVRP